MRFSLCLFAACVAAFSANAQAPDPSPTTPVETLELAAFEPTREEAVLEAYVDGVVEAHMRQHKTPGVTVSVVKDGKLLFAKGYGFADIDAAKPVSGQDTLFRIGSVSKTFVWTAAMMLAERGEIDLDEDVNTYLKGIQLPEAFGAPVTMNDLMAHRAGFEETFGLFTHTDETDVTLTEGLIADMPKRVHAPGARTSYSNWGTALAAKIIEDVSGKPFESFMQDEILTPLAMTKTTLKSPLIAEEPLRSQYSKGYAIEQGAAIEQEIMQIGPFAPVGAIGSTAADMAQWMLLLLGEGEHNGARLYSGETAQQMWTRAFDDRVTAGDLAHGFFTKKYYGYDVYGHGGATASFLTFMQVIPALDAGVYISQNAAPNRNLVNELPDLIVARLAEAGRSPGVTMADGLTVEAAAEYAGTYLSNRRSFSRFEKLFGVADAVSVSRNEAGALEIATGAGPRVVLPLAGEKDVFQTRDGNRIAFGRNEAGRVTYFSAGPQSFERTGFFQGPMMLNVAFGLAGLFATTILVGAWRRQGGAPSQTSLGRGIGLFSMSAAVLVFVLLGALGVAMAALSSMSAADLVTYPPASVVWFRTIALAMFVVSALGVVAIAPAWTKSGWSIWRKLHYIAFAASLALLGIVLVLWKIIFAPIS